MPNDLEAPGWVLRFSTKVRDLRRRAGPYRELPLGGRDRRALRKTNGGTYRKKRAKRPDHASRCG